MKCRHCLVEFHAEWADTRLQPDVFGSFWVFSTKCPACGRANLCYSRAYAGDPRIFFYPKATAREPLDASVPADMAQLYREACDVLESSARASAALSRHILQRTLHQCANIRARSLNDEIDQVLASKALPGHIADALDAVRHLGNFAAHPIKSTSTGQIVDVEPGEAEWNLDTIEALFDFYYAQPARTAARRAALNQKLADAGKPQLK